MLNLRRTSADLLALLGGRHVQVAVLVTLGMLATLAEACGLALFIPVLTGLEGVDLPLFGWLSALLASPRLPFSNWPEPVTLGVMVMIAFGLRSLLLWGNTRLLVEFDVALGKDIRSKLFQRMITTSGDEVLLQQRSEVFETLITESGRAADGVHCAIQIFIHAAAAVVLAFGLALTFTPHTWPGLALLAAAYAFHRYFSRDVKALSRRFTNANQQLANEVVETWQGLRDVRLFGAEERFRQRFEQNSIELGEVGREAGARWAMLRPVFELAAALGVVTTFVWANLNGASLTPIGIFVMLLLRLEPKLREIESQILALRLLNEGISRVARTIRALGPDEERPEQPLDTPLDLQTTDLGFHYPHASSPALEGVSLRIRQREVVQIVGANGSGKSTLAHLLSGWYTPTSGALKINDTELKDIPFSQWRSQVVLLTHDSKVFADTVAQNISMLGNSNDIDKVKQASQLAQADKFILQLKQGYNESLGEGGRQLSTGQSQRVVLSRAFYRNPKLVILDEACNSLPTESAESILQQLRELKSQPAIVWITHQELPGHLVDTCYRMDGGRLSRAD